MFIVFCSEYRFWKSVFCRVIYLFHLAVFLTDAFKIAWMLVAAVPPTNKSVGSHVSGDARIIALLYHTVMHAAEHLNQLHSAFLVLNRSSACDSCSAFCSLRGFDCSVNSFDSSDLSFINLLVGRRSLRLRPMHRIGRNLCTDRVPLRVYMSFITIAPFWLGGEHLASLFRCIHVFDSFLSSHGVLMSATHCFIQTCWGIHISVRNGLKNAWSLIPVCMIPPPPNVVGLIWNSATTSISGYANSIQTRLTTISRRHVLVWLMFSGLLLLLLGQLSREYNFIEHIIVQMNSFSFFRLSYKLFCNPI